MPKVFSLFSFLLLTFGGLLSACQDKQNSEIKALSPTQMAKVLIEIHLAESQIPHLALSPDSAQQIYKVFENKVFEKTGVDSGLYYQSYQYYINRVEEFEKIYMIVIDSLAYRESKMDIGKPMDTSGVPKKNIKPRSLDSSGLEIRRKIKLLNKKDIISQS